MKRKKFAIFMMCIASIIIIYSLINIFIWGWDNYTVEQEINQIEKSEVINDKYLKVDFSSLKETNSEVVAWIYVPGTEINYPVVQHSDNEYYLNHSLDHSKNKAGWVFLDYRNNTNELDPNTIIYGHERKNGVMFGSLKNLLSNEWYQNQENHIVKTSTQCENQLWQVFSVYTTPITTDYIQNDFENEESTQEFMNKIKERSVFNFNTTITSKDKVLTLSTCHNNNERMVMHAQLIENQKRENISL